MSKIINKIKDWFIGISEVVTFITTKFDEGKTMAENKEKNFKTWYKFIISFLSDMYTYIEQLESLVKSSTTAKVSTKSTASSVSNEAKVKSVKLGGEYTTQYWKDRVNTFNK